MKKAIYILLCLVLVFNFTGCSKIDEKQEKGQSYESVIEMRNENLGVWTSEDGFSQLCIEKFKVTYTVRDSSNYEDSITEYKVLEWDKYNGWITIDDNDDYVLVKEGGKIVEWCNGGKSTTRFEKGGELAKRPIPETTLLRVVSDTIYKNYMWSADFNTLCSKVTRNVSVQYYAIEDYEVSDEILEIAEQLDGEAYIVTLTGEVSQNPEIPYLYYPAEEFAKFFIVLDGDELVYSGYFDISRNFVGATSLYFASAY